MIAWAAEPAVPPVARVLPDNGARRYWQWLDRKSDDERRALSEIKRLRERYRGDRRFRTALKQPDSDPRRLAADHGIALDPTEVWPLLTWLDPELPSARAAGNPLLVQAWHAYHAELLASLEDFVRAGDSAEANPNFAAWRRRQIHRVRSEVGEAGESIKHPVIAFELSAGCSVGCWFCGVGAGKFTENYAYTPEHGNMWRGILQECTAIFGQAVQTGFCYWATEPADNPDYPHFISDFHDITGALPSTTSAMPLKDLALTRRVLDLHAERGGMVNRFSILNLRMLDRVHATFSPLELLGVELVLQNPEALQTKAFAGRAREQAERLQKNNGQPASDGATIACVSGFLVSMVGGTIRLISPTAASERWPLGYRVLGERRFTSAEEFRRVIHALIADHMPMTIAASARLALREDLTFECEGDRFTLGSRGTRYGFGGFAGAGLLGAMLEEGRSTCAEIQAALTPLDADPLVVGDALQRLFERGLIEQVRDEPAAAE